MEENYLADNAAIENMAEGSAAAAEDGLEKLQEEETTKETEETNLTPAVAANDSEVSEDISKTKAFSERLNKMSDRKVNDFISKMGWTNTYTNEPIRTKEEYDEFMSMHEAQEKGSDPILSAKVRSLENKIDQYAIKEQDQALLDDPEMGFLYKRYREDVMNLVEAIKKTGSTRVDLKAAFSTVLTNGKLKEIIESEKKKATDETTKKIQANASASVGALSSESSNGKIDFSAMSSAEFDKYVQRALRGEKIRL